MDINNKKLKKNVGRPQIYGEGKVNKKEFKNELVMCKCGSHVKRLNMSQHLKSKKHDKILKLQNDGVQNEINAIDLKIREVSNTLNHLRRMRKDKTYLL